MVFGIGGGGNKGKEPDAAAAAAAAAPAADAEAPAAAADAESSNAAVASSAPSAAAPPAAPKRSIVTRAPVTIGYSGDLTFGTAHALVAALMAFIAVSGVCTLALSWRRGWGWRPGALDATEVALRWGYTDYRGLLAPEGARFHQTPLGVGPQVFGAFVVVALWISVLFAIYVFHTSLMFSRGWYEAASAAGGLRAALPGFAVGGNLLLWSGVFYGLTQFRVHYAVPGPRRLRPGWAFYLSLGQTLAWLLASHVLSRMPPVELVQAWTGGIAAAAAAAAPAAAAAATTAAAGSSNGGEGSSSAAPAAAAAAPAAAPERASSSVKLRPILGKLPSSLRESLGKVPGVEIV